MFSLIIPLYNKQGSINQTITSVLNQTYKNFELLIIDDGSTDESAEIARKRSVTDPRICLILKPNGGVCSARNEGIRLAKYDYIALLDADDEWIPSYLDEQRKMIADFQEAAMWGMNFAPIVDGNIEWLETGLPIYFRNYIKDYFSMKRSSDLFCSSSVVIRKSCFERSGLFDTRIKYSEDLDMWYRIILNYPVAFNNKVMVYYHQNAENRALTGKRRLKHFLPYYVDKYAEFKNNTAFYNFIHRWSAIHIRNYYFNVKSERQDAFEAASKLDYDVIPIKYKYMFKTSYPIGKMVYLLSTLKRKLLS